MMRAHFPPLLHVVLDRPRMAGNIGAVVRLCAGTGAALHVCGPLEFPEQELTQMKRAGLDYWGLGRVHFHHDVHRCLALLERAPWVVEKGGQHAPWDVALLRGEVVVLGPEDGSVDDAVRLRDPARVLTLPQMPGARSLNLAQCAAIVAYEAVRQQGGVAADGLDPAD